MAILSGKQLIKSFLMVVTVCMAFTTEVSAALTTPVCDNEPETDSISSASREIFIFVEESPWYPGGSDELKKFFMENLEYPEEAKNQHVQGEVFVRFEVKSDGSIGEAQIAKSVHPALDQEALRVIKSMPPWLPGRFRGEAVNSWYTLPVSFVLRN